MINLAGNLWKFLRIFQQIEYFSPQISRNFAGIAGNDRELLEVCEFCRKIMENSEIFPGKGENESEFREKGKGRAPNLN